jgi:hypothetical protein
MLRVAWEENFFSEWLAENAERVSDCGYDVQVVIVEDVIRSGFPLECLAANEQRELQHQRVSWRPPPSVCNLASPGTRSLKAANLFLA